MTDDAPAPDDRPHDDGPAETPEDAPARLPQDGSDLSPLAEATAEIDSEEALEAEVEQEVERGQRSGGSAAVLVAVGIFASRVIGLIRDRLIGYFFGVGAFSDVYRLGLRAPNLLQNLLGEGTLSAAFIPIYSRMTEEGREEDARAFAGAILGLLAVVAFGAALLGVLLAEPFVTVLQPGWLGDAEAVRAGTIPVNRFDLAVTVVRLAFPMTAILVLSAWALGVLNSHRKFLLSYLAPVAWNVALLVALGVGAWLYLDDPTGLAEADVVPSDALSKLLVAVFVGGIAGGVLQLGVQLPTVWRLLGGIRPRVSTAVVGVRDAIKAFVPVVLGRGAYQLSGYFDTFLSSFLAAGALAALGNAQTLYLLPVSLFGMSVAASELPELSRISTDKLDAFLERVRGSVAQIFYLIVPTTVGYLGFGFLVVAVLYQTGRFDLDDTWLVYLVLAGYSLGLVATTASRLLQNAFYALSDTKTPARLAVWRMVVSAVVGAGLMLVLDQLSVPEVIGIAAEGEPLRLGAVGLALGSAVGAWIELWRLVAALRGHAASFSLPWGRALQMLGLAGLAAIPAALLRWLVPAEPFPVWLYGAVVLAVYGFSYLALGHAMGFSEGDAWTGRFLSRLPWRKKG